MNIKIKCNDEFIAHILDENYKEIREEKSNSFNSDSKTFANSKNIIIFAAQLSINL